MAPVVVTQQQIADLQNQINTITNNVNSLTEDLNGVAYGENVMWILICATLIFFMQAGFAMVEAGSVRSKNVVNILYKNLMDGAVVAICYWFLGYGFAFGNSKGGFIGVSQYGLTSAAFDFGETDYAANLGMQNQPAFQDFFIQWAYAAVAVTIVGGALSERCKIEAYFIYAAAVSIWIFPIIVHWCWGQGWLSPNSDRAVDYLFYGASSNSYIDQAGSGVVHAVGGVSALLGCITIGARKVCLTFSFEFACV